jgi:DNA-binding NarL/FixJ family response regulator
MRDVMNVLIVDDSMIASGRVRLMLEEIEGVNVVGHAVTVSEAMMFLKVWLPHLIVLDLEMPDGNGIEVLRHIKQWNRTTTVAVLTNSTAEPVRRECEESGADYFLDKSRDYERFPEIITEVRRRNPAGMGLPSEQPAPRP